MIYQHVNKTTEILLLSLAAFHIVQLLNQFNRAFALLIFMPRFESIKFY